MVKISSNSLKDAVGVITSANLASNIAYMSNGIKLEVSKGKLFLYTTDVANTVRVSCKVIQIESAIDVSLDLLTFTKLISKLGEGDISLSLINKSLSIKQGKGSYLLDLLLDEEGNNFPINIVDPVQEPQVVVEGKVLHSIYDSCNVGVSTNTRMPLYTGYYLGTHIFTTDTNKLAKLEGNKLGVAMLLNPVMVKLFKLFPETDQVSFIMTEDGLTFTSSTICIQGPDMPGYEDYEVDAISNLFDTVYPHSVKLNRSSLLSLLDRASLFTTLVDRLILTMRFNSEGLHISTNDGKCLDMLPYSEPAQVTEDFVCTVNIELLEALLKSCKSDNVVLNVGISTSIHIQDGTMVYILATLQDEVS